jgi:threonine/homoserine/homoserine lactone efflux protein
VGRDEMWTLLPQGAVLASFLTTSIVLALAPGPGVIFIVTRTLSQGRWAGLSSVCGVSLGNFCNAIAAVLGLAALFSVAPVLAAAVRYAGAAYLAYLGIRNLRSPPASANEVMPAFSYRKMCRDAFFVALLNPKTTLFFAALLPQFVSRPAARVGQSLLLGVLFVTIATITDTTYALTAGAIGPRLTHGAATRSIGRYASTVVLLALSIFAVTGH